MLETYLELLQEHESEINRLEADARSIDVALAELEATGLVAEKVSAARDDVLTATMKLGSTLTGSLSRVRKAVEENGREIKTSAESLERVQLQVPWP